MSVEADKTSQVEAAVAQGGAYEVIRKRLTEQGAQLKQLASQLNQDRLAEFGSSDLQVVSRIRIRTENNSIARDMVQVGDYLLFGYNVYIGLKKETGINDVFAVYQLHDTDGEQALMEVSLENTFLAEASFASDFDELYRFYKHTKLVELTVKDSKLLAGFQIGERLEDIRVFRWSISADGKEINYIDNRGERDIQLPPAYDFEWTPTSREDFVNGRYPHISILDKVFVETVAGDLTIKIENNTEDGLGIYSEPVDDKTQSLDDAQVYYAQLGGLLLLKVLPYRETDWRYLVFNSISEQVLRIDAIGQSCVQLPEDHGIIFPGGIYLQTGEFKAFDLEMIHQDSAGLKYKRTIKSPNGEDVLYVFYEPRDGVVGMFAYNLISKALQNPIYAHGNALFDDGRLVVFSAEQEPTRIHPMQIWQSPFVSEEHASQQQVSQTFFGKIGNATLVRGISDLFSISRQIENQSVSSRSYDELQKSAARVFDNHYWIEDIQANDDSNSIAAVLKAINETADLVLDEFEKVQSIRAQSQQAMTNAEQQQTELLRSIRPENFSMAEQYVEALDAIRHQRGHLVTIKSYRYIDTDRIATLDTELLEQQTSLSEKTVSFLADEKALSPYHDKVDKLTGQIEKTSTVAELAPVVEIVEKTASGLDLLSELMATLKVQDATLRTQIIDAISEVYSRLNQTKARARQKQKSLGSKEAVAQFAAQFKLFSQSVTNALGMSTTPEKSDEQLSRLLVQLEELESQFSEYDEFLSDIIAKREEVYESFESHKQQLLNARQAKAQSVSDAAARILASIERRSLKFSDDDELNTYFASDALVVKVRELVERLRDLDNAVKADDIEARFKALKEQAIRALRDKSDIFEDGGKIIKLGPRHKFSVNTQSLDLTMIPREGKQHFHLTGTDFFEAVELAELSVLRDYWDISVESETPLVYRAEYLAYLIIDAAMQNQAELSMQTLRQALLNADDMLALVKDFATPRYKESYEKGIHDHDAAKILMQLLPVMESAGLLKYSPLSRAFVQIFWANIQAVSASSLQVLIDIKQQADTWQERAQSAAHMQKLFESHQAVQLLVDEVAQAFELFLKQFDLPISDNEKPAAASYLVAELSRDQLAFVSSKYAQELVSELKRSMDDVAWRKYQSSLEKLQGQPDRRWHISHSWLQALVGGKNLTHLGHYLPEAIALLNSEARLPRRETQADVEFSVKQLLGEHPRIRQQTLALSLDDYFSRVEHHQRIVVTGYYHYLQLRQQAIETQKAGLSLDSFKPRPLSSFVRNRLINESYLPIIGDNLAKQMGTVGESKRTDLMGLLMMISPPGYGKTTLMEYVANRLGLIFMKINCPSLGHDVLSLDPQQAPNATARQELEKLNLGLEMGNNVMLYLDDIQHTHAEFLQKFISLCDATRRIEGVWKGRTKTYDMRGKKFCVVMAGNPYTESGEVFKIPDMLANRADIYNLGDILGGMDEQFALSYIENSLTSNAVLAPLATRDMADVYKLVSMARGENIATTDLSHQYSAAEINEMTEVLKKQFVIRDVVLKINQQYIASAAQDDKYRTEPPFKLQGSYRNMNKMAEKVTAVMNHDELMQMISDHYQGESQLLTAGAEENLLKLAELRGNMTEQESLRWGQIKQDFLRNKAMGGEDADTGARVVAQLTDIVLALNTLSQSKQPAKTENPNQLDTEQFEQLRQQLGQIANSFARQSAVQPKVEVINQPLPGMDQALSVVAETFETSIYPLLRLLDKKFDIDLTNQQKMIEISKKLEKIQSDLKLKG